MESILDDLNQAQKAAVTSHASVLQVLAPPGSGKTKTLTARAAYLIAHHGINPRNIIVCTFTNKAAKEMGERICSFLGKDVASKLVLGTFHSIARRFLSREGKQIGIDPKFGIADTSDSNSIITRIIKRMKGTITTSQARARISKLKSQNITSEQFAATNRAADQQEVSQIYSEYEEHLRVEKLLDFDDLVLRCAELLRRYPGCVSHIEAVLIDEFQDTNTVQYELMELFAQKRETITIVGDPDQSIYGWRNAEIKNLKKMQERFPDTHVINLEENYRSSGAILLAAQEIIEQDKARPAKRLMPTLSVGLRPVLRKLPSASAEAAWIVSEMTRTTALTDNLLTWSDYAVLLRSASLSRLVETALGKAGIPYRMVGGHRFFDRIEVKLVLDYLRVISHPSRNDALVRVLNVPPRGIGERSVQLLLEEADETRLPLWSIITSFVQGDKKTKTPISAQAAQGVSSFFNIIMTAQKRLRQPQDDEENLSAFLDHIIRKIGLQKYLKDLNKKDSEEFEGRWANVQELVAQALEFCCEMDSGETFENADELLENVNEDVVAQGNSIEDVLSQFLANVALATDATVATEDGQPKAQVTLSTIHAAKGLEWPIVFIPSAYAGSIPHSRAEDNDEERRLLYVAMTRAKSILNVSCPTCDSKRVKTTLSPFLSEVDVDSYFDQRGPDLGFEEAKELATILRRPCPTIAQIAAASRLVEHPRDNQWPLNGEYQETERRQYEMGANIDEASYEANRKRRRTEGGGFETVAGRTWSKTHSTSGIITASTLHCAHTLSTTTSTLQSSFSKASAIYAVETNQSQCVGTGAVGKKRRVDESTSLTQGSLTSFFGPSIPKSVTIAEVARVSSGECRAMPLKDITSRTNAAEMTQQRNFLTCGTNTLPAAQVTRVHEKIDPSASLTGYKHATTLHVTSMDQVESLVPPVRKGLGMRMGLNRAWQAKSK